MTREEWLSKLINEFRPDFKRAGRPLPDKIRISVGWPFGKRVSGGQERIGECWLATATKDKKPQVFVSPTQEDPVQVASVVVHELVHACGIGGHKADFAAVARTLGLEGKMTCTVPSAELKGRLQKIVKRLGKFDHVAIDPSKDTERPKQGTRLVKVMCPDPACGYPARVTRKWIDEKGTPTCPCGEVMLEDGGDGE